MADSIEQELIEAIRPSPQRSEWTAAVRQVVDDMLRAYPSAIEADLIRNATIAVGEADDQGDNVVMEVARVLNDTISSNTGIVQADGSTMYVGNWSGCAFVTDGNLPTCTALDAIYADPQKVELNIPLGVLVSELDGGRGQVASHEPILVRSPESSPADAWIAPPPHGKSQRKRTSMKALRGGHPSAPIKFAEDAIASLANERSRIEDGLEPLLSPEEIAELGKTVAGISHVFHTTSRHSILHGMEFINGTPPDLATSFEDIVKRGDRAVRMRKFRILPPTPRGERAWRNASSREISTHTKSSIRVPAPAATK